MVEGSWQVRQTGQRAVIRVPGDLDITTLGGLGQALGVSLQAGAAEVIVDASHVSYCSSSGITALVRASRQAAAAGVRMQVAPSEVVRQMIDLTATAQLLEICPAPA
jgi:anti-anti-sigma factor